MKKNIPIGNFVSIVTELIETYRFQTQGFHVGKIVTLRNTDQCLELSEKQKNRNFLLNSPMVNFDESKKCLFCKCNLEGFIFACGDCILKTKFATLCDAIPLRGDIGMFKFDVVRVVCASPKEFCVLKNTNDCRMRFTVSEFQSNAHVSTETF